MDLKDCSLLIQGPFHQNSIIGINYLGDFFGEIVYSTYPVSDELYDFLKDNNIEERTKLIINDNNKPRHVLPDNVGLIQQNLHKQVISTYNGLKKCTKKYVLKMRSDEYYLGLDKITDFVKEDKINFVNIFFRHFNRFPYHPSDHMFLAEKSVLVDVFDILHRSCYVNFEEFTLRTCQDPNVQLFAEQAICLAFLHKLTGGIKIPFHDIDYNVMLFKKFFHIFTAKSIGPYCVCSSRINHHGKQFVTNIEDSPLWLKNDCHSMGQYR
jgi:hypothetical protein